MKKMQSLNEKIYQTLEAQEMNAVKGGFREASPDDGGASRTKQMQGVTVHSNGKPAEVEGDPKDDGPDW